MVKSRTREHSIIAESSFTGGPCSPNPCGLGARCVPLHEKAYCHCIGSVEFFKIGSKSCQTAEEVMASSSNTIVVSTVPSKNLGDALTFSSDDVLGHYLMIALLGCLVLLLPLCIHGCSRRHDVPPAIYTKVDTSPSSDV